MREASWFQAEMGIAAERAALKMYHHYGVFDKDSCLIPPRKCGGTSEFEVLVPSATKPRLLPLGDAASLIQAAVGAE